MESKRRGREKKGSKKCKSEKRWRVGEWQNWGKEHLQYLCLFPPRF